MLVYSNKLNLLTDHNHDIQSYNQLLDTNSRLNQSQHPSYSTDKFSFIVPDFQYQFMHTWLRRWFLPIFFAVHADKWENFRTDKLVTGTGSFAHRVREHSNYFLNMIWIYTLTTWTWLFWYICKFPEGENLASFLDTNKKKRFYFILLRIAVRLGHKKNWNSEGQAELGREDYPVRQD